KYRSFPFRSAILRPFSTITVDKCLKTIGDLSGRANYFGFGMARQVLLAKIATKQPLGKLALPGQFAPVEKFGPIHISDTTSRLPRAGRRQEVLNTKSRTLPTNCLKGN
ncbi:hypothetical protein QZH41_008267, partial [Actinostola sp. cb2023]